MSNLLFKKWNDFSGWIVFVIAAFVYGMTIEPTVSFGTVPNLFRVPKSYKWGIRRVHLSICLLETCLLSLLPTRHKCPGWLIF